MSGEVDPKELSCTAFIPSLPTVIWEIVHLNPTFSVSRKFVTFILLGYLYKMLEMGCP